MEERRFDYVGANKTLAILGFGDDGRYWAHFLKDKGVRVVIGLRQEDDALWSSAKGDGFPVYDLWDVAAEADILQVW